MQAGRAIACLLTVLLAAAGMSRATATETPDTAELTVVVENLRSDRGEVRVALWQGPEGFTKAKAALAKKRLEPQNGTARVTFPGLAPGRYALAIYHDENDNGKFDRTWLGLPKEGLGFSNGAWISLAGAPSFKAAAVELAPGVRSIVISLRYSRNRAERWAQDRGGK